MDAWVREVADQTAPQTVLHRYHFADHSAFAALRPLRGKSLTAHAASLIESNRINVHASRNTVLNPWSHPLDSVGIIAYDGYIKSNRTLTTE